MAIVTHAADGGALPAEGRMMMGTDGSLAQFVSVDSDGKLQVGGSVTTTASTWSTVTSGQVAVTNSSTQIVAASASRKFIEIMNFNSAALYIGPTGVTTANGHYIAAGAAFTTEASICTGAIYGVYAADPSAAKVSYIAGA